MSLQGYWTWCCDFPLCPLSNFSYSSVIGYPLGNVVMPIRKEVTFKFKCSRLLLFCLFVCFWALMFVISILEVIKCCLTWLESTGTSTLVIRWSSSYFVRYQGYCFYLVKLASIITLWSTVCIIVMKPKRLSQ